MKTVWVLGAGFSKPLGGPLLTELFGDNMAGYLKQTFTSEYPAIHKILFDESESGTVRDLFKRSASLNVGGRLDHWLARWRDAEEFLDVLDGCARSPEPADRAMKGVVVNLLKSHPLPGRIQEKYGLKGPGKSDNDYSALLTGLNHCARRLLAAECSAFVENGSLGLERWRNYGNWASSLTPDDTIITFNYDLVLEKLDAEIPQRNAPFRFVLPGDPCEPSASVDVFKLHGSVNWRSAEGRYKRADILGEANDAAVSPESRYFALWCKPDQMAIATPGPSKARMTQQWEAYWTLACGRVADASVVNFVGYRFPETDAIALDKLLTALRKGPDTARWQIVLGPDVTHQHPKRLHGLLKHLVGTEREHLIGLVPLYSQDFLLLEAIKRGPAT